MSEPVAVRGFTLLEVLVAFAVFASTTAAVMGSIGGSLRGSRVSAEQAVATLIAESKIAATGIESPLSDGETSGAEGEFDWKIVSARYPIDHASDRIAQPEIPYRVTVVVGWTEGGRGRTVELRTLRYGPGD